MHPRPPGLAWVWDVVWGGEWPKGSPASWGRLRLLSWYVGSGHALPPASCSVLPLLSGLANHGQTRHMVRGWAPPHTCARVCSQLPWALGGGPAGPVEGQAAACPRPSERPHPLGVLGCRAICQAALWGLLGCNVQHGGPRAAPVPSLAAGTKPEPPAQREVVPHQSAPDPGGLPAPCQAAADELD